MIFNMLKNVETCYFYIFSLNKKKNNWFRRFGYKIIQYLKWMCSYPVYSDDHENILKLQTSCSNAVLCYSTMVEYQNIQE